MRIDEVTGDEKLDSFLAKMQDPTILSKAGFYPFVVRHPFNPKQAVTITDIPNFDAFEHLWGQLPEIIQSEFAPGTPVIVNKEREPIQDSGELLKTRGIGNVVPMTYSQYVSIIANSLGQ